MSSPFQDDTQTEAEVKDCRDRFEGLVAQRVALLKAREVAASSVEPSQPRGDQPEPSKPRSLPSRILSVVKYTIIAILFLLVMSALGGLLEGIVYRTLTYVP